MIKYRKYLQVANINILVKSDNLVLFNKDVELFEHEFKNSSCNVVFNLVNENIKLNFISKEMDIIFEGKDINIYEDANSFIRVAYLDGRKKDIKWILQWSKEDNLVTEYTLYYADNWKHRLLDFNPLFLPGLPEFLINYQSFILHSSVIDYKGNGIVFTAPSGTGKSTQAHLWEKYKKALVINGDRSLIRKFNDQYRVFGSPYAGSSYIYMNHSVKLKFIIVLRQGLENNVKRLYGKEAFLCLISETLLSKYDKFVIDLQSKLLLDLLNNIPVYLFSCKPDFDAVKTIEKLLEGE